MTTSNKRLSYYYEVLDIGGKTLIAGTVRAADRLKAYAAVERIVADSDNPDLVEAVEAVVVRKAKF